MDGERGLADLVRRRARSYLDDRERDPRVIAALAAVDRAEFLPPGGRAYAYLDEALPIGRGQTCSQPSMVAFMLDALELGPGLRLLEVGSGSGWAAAIAAELVSPGGLVVACEIEQELARGLEARFRGRADIRVVQGDGSEGLPELGPWDRILLSAGVRRYRKAGGTGEGFEAGIIMKTLAPGGVLLFPEVAGSLFRMRLDGKAPKGIRVEAWEGVGFVRLRGRNA